MKHIKTGKERTKEDLSALRKTVSEIIEDVVANGDAALRSYSEKFDGFARPVFRVSREEIDDAYSHVSEQELNDMKSALANIRTFAEAQRATIHDLPEFSRAPASYSAIASSPCSLAAAMSLAGASRSTPRP